MRNKKSFITSPKQQLEFCPTDLISVVIYEQFTNNRLKSHGSPFIKVHGKPLLDKQVEAIQATFKNFEIVFCCGGSNTLKVLEHIKSKFANVNIRIVENQNFTTTNCCESLRVALNNINNSKILICPEDLLLTHNHLKLLKLNTSCLMMQDLNQDNNFDISVIQHNNTLENLVIGIKNSYWSEVLFINGNKEASDLHSIVSHPDFKNKLVFEAVNQLNKKHTIEIILTNKPILKLNNNKTLKRISLE